MLFSSYMSKIKYFAEPLDDRSQLKALIDESLEGYIKDWMGGAIRW
jgi:hypothetical protein